MWGIYQQNFNQWRIFESNQSFLPFICYHPPIGIMSCLYVLGENDLIIKCLHCQVERILDGRRGRWEQWKSPHTVPPKLCDIYFEPQSTTQVKTQSSGNSQCRPISPPKDPPAIEPLQGSCLSLAALLERFLQTSPGSPSEDNSLLDHPKSQVHHLSQLSTLPY